ncbi:4Fe-4S dicluster domain-containing protein [Plasticicumulans acidivorans]|uniref:4Fe-4S binding protein n=1 Tax=Plasticicumulans acidivorans TaxID=886464 RepID=A0A317MSB1_9GAMM|nr:4Fe-4S binding protein [Plasticicumulans acidivorans]PWV59008.1 4Fe-4S binding protein [Plasticicumulans acidivorans]
MAMKIVAMECIACGDCKPVCPTKSISEKGGIFKIDKATCTECEGDFDEPKCVEVCPVDGCIVQIAA